VRSVDPSIFYLALQTLLTWANSPARLSGIGTFS
jgi:hypothetical protein